MKLDFQGGSISRDDWEAIREALDEYDIKSVLEFGGGVSTLMFHNHGCRVVCLETDKRWIDAIKGGIPDADVRWWDNATFPCDLDGSRFDLAFVDGKEPRRSQLVHAIHSASMVILHDASRRQEQELARYHLYDWEELPIRGRCRMFRAPLHKYAFITSASGNYMQYLTALLNSMDEQGQREDIHIMSFGLPEEYIEAVEGARLSLTPYFHRCEIDGTGEESKGFRIQKARYRNNHQLGVKNSRYACLEDLMQRYDAVCILDCDMFFVRNVSRFFGLVCGTDTIVGVNESFKWNMNMFELDGETLEDRRMYWMACNAPLFFSPRRNIDFVKMCNHTAKNLLRNGGAAGSDLMTMNVAAGLTGASERMVHLHPACWTGVHNAYVNIYTMLQQRPEGWFTRDGMPVYVIHGRWDRAHDNAKAAEAYFVSEQEKRYNELELPEHKRQWHRNACRNIYTLLKGTWEKKVTQGKIKLFRSGKDGLSWSTYRKAADREIHDNGQLQPAAGVNGVDQRVTDSDGD